MNKHPLHLAIGLALSAVAITGCSQLAVHDADSTVAQTYQPAAFSALGAAGIPGGAMPPISAMEECEDELAAGKRHFFKVGKKKVKAIKVRATGYGAPPKSFYPDPQRRLMAMRAAKIDAYRSLAERIFGVQIWGGTTLGDMVVEKDRFRVYLDAHLQGAKVLAENPNEDGTYETIVELTIRQTFLDDTLPAREKKVSQECSPMKKTMTQAKPHPPVTFQVNTVAPPAAAPVVSFDGEAEAVVEEKPAPMAKVEPAPMATMEPVEPIVAAPEAKMPAAKTEKPMTETENFYFSE